MNAKTPKLAKKTYVTMSVGIRIEYLELLDGLAAEQKTSRSDILRQILDQWIDDVK